MSEIVFDCPECGGRVTVDYADAGRELPCPHCTRVVVIPVPGGGRHGHAKLGKPVLVVHTVEAQGAPPTPHQVPVARSEDQKPCACCGALVPVEARTCPECMHQFPPPRHSAEVLHVREEVGAKEGGGKSSGRAFGAHQVTARCPSCGSRLFLVCDDCDRSDRLRLGHSAATCVCGGVTDQVVCPRCDKKIKRRHFRVHFGALSGVPEDQVPGTGDEAEDG